MPGWHRLCQPGIKQRHTSMRDDMSEIKPVKYRVLSEDQKTRVANEVMLMLFAHRDSLWNRHALNPESTDPLVAPFQIQDGYYGEAFGILRGLHCLGYGYFGPVNLDGREDRRGGTDPHHNLKWWMDQLERACL